MSDWQTETITDMRQLYDLYLASVKPHWHKEDESPLTYEEFVNEDELPLAAGIEVVPEVGHCMDNHNIWDKATIAMWRFDGDYDPRYEYKLQSQYGNLFSADSGDFYPYIGSTQWKADQYDKLMASKQEQTGEAE